MFKYSRIMAYKAMIQTDHGVEISVNPEYESLVPKLSSSAYESLKQSIQENGLIVPIIVNRQGIILDGHNRFKACQELGVQVVFDIKDFGEDKLKEKFYVIESNLCRRHINSFQRIELAHKFESIYAEMAKGRKLASLNNNPSSVQNYTDDQKGRAIEKCAKAAHVSPITYDHARYIINNASEEIKNDLRAGRISIDKTYHALKEERKRKENMPQSELHLPQSGVQIFNADFRDKGDSIPDESIDLVFTDCSIIDSYVQRDAMRFAARILHKGGYFVTYIDKNKIRTLLDASKQTGLSYLWLIISVVESKFVPAHIYGFEEHCRAILVFCKGIPPSNAEKIPDLIDHKDPGQGPAATVATHIVRSFSKEGGLVCDIFLDESRTVPALKMKRKVVGFIPDEQKFQSAKHMIEILSST